MALLCGDVEKQAQRYLLRQSATGRQGEPVAGRPGNGLAAQVLVLPHHGSAGASLAGFYRAVRPELALASCGYGNQWNFPSEAARKNLADLGIRLLDTASKGQIVVEWTANGKMAVTSARP